MEPNKTTPEAEENLTSTPDATTSTTDTETPISGIVTSENNKTHTKKPMLLLIVLLVLGLGVGGYLIATKKDTKSPSKTTSVTKYDISNLKVGIEADNLMNELPENADTNSTTMSIFYQTHEGLVAFENLTQIKPRIAVSWTNPNDLTWSFKITDNRTFHTGKKLTAKDVVASLNAEMKSGFWDTSFVTIDSVELDAKDPTLVVIKTKTPDSVLLNRLTVLPIYDVDYKAGQSWASGTGAYTLKAGSTPTMDSLELTADDTYPLGKPSVRSVTYTNHTDGDVYSKNILDGKFDLANIEAIDSAKLKANTSLAVTKVKSLGSFFASLNNDRPNGPLKDKKVREAIAHILQGSKFATVGGREDEVATQIVPSEVPGYSTAIKGTTYDLDKAKSLLKEAGFATPSALTVKVGYFAGAQDDDAAELIAELKAAGITVVTETKSSGADFTKAIDTEQYDIIMYSYSTAINDITDIALDTAGSKGIYNQYTNANIDTLVSDANATFDQTKRLAKLQDVNKAITNDFGIIPLRTSVYSLVYKNNVVCSEDIPTPDYVCYFWKTYSNKNGN